jgi:hypothetical protein
MTPTPRRPTLAGRGAVVGAVGGVLLALFVVKLYDADIWERGGDLTVLRNAIALGAVLWAGIGAALGALAPILLEPDRTEIGRGALWTTACATLTLLAAVGTFAVLRLGFGFSKDHATYFALAFSGPGLVCAWVAGLLVLDAAAG